MNSWKRCIFVKCMDNAEMGGSENIIDNRIKCQKDLENLEI